MSGGPTRNAQYPIIATALTRAAGLSVPSAAADIPRGNPSETPKPHRTVPITTSQIGPPRMNSSRPTTPRPAVMRMALVRPTRSTSGPPTTRPTVIAATKHPKMSAPVALD